MKKFDLMKYVEACLDDNTMRGLLGHFLLFKDKWLSIDGKGVGDSDYDNYVSEILKVAGNTLPVVGATFDKAMVDDYTPVDNLSNVFKGALSDVVLHDLNPNLRFAKGNVMLAVISPVGCMLFNDKFDVLGLIVDFGVKDGRSTMQIYALNDTINDYKDDLDDLLYDKDALPIIMASVMASSILKGHDHTDDCDCAKVDTSKMN